MSFEQANRSRWVSVRGVVNGAGAFAAAGRVGSGRAAGKRSVSLSPSLSRGGGGGGHTSVDLEGGAGDGAGATTAVGASRKAPFRKRALSFRSAASAVPNVDHGSGEGSPTAAAATAASPPVTFAASLAARLAALDRLCEQCPGAFHHSTSAPTAAAATEVGAGAGTDSDAGTDTSTKISASEVAVEHAVRTVAPHGGDGARVAGGEAAAVAPVSADLMLESVLATALDRRAAPTKPRPAAVAQQQVVATAAPAPPPTSRSSLVVPRVQAAQPRSGAPGAVPGRVITAPAAPPAAPPRAVLPKMEFDVCLDHVDALLDTFSRAHNS